MWNPLEHSDQENLRFCWLRSVEWGVWPRFVAQPIVPVLLLFYDWKWVVLGVVVATYLWALVRYEFVSVHLASIGALFVRLKWISCPVSAWLLYSRGQRMQGILALLWPVATLVLAITGPTTQIGRIEQRFMNELGYAESVGRANGA